jgi:hypothetical protein
MPSEVVIMGESFYAATGGIQKRIESDARAAGTLGGTDTYRSVAVSGQNMSSIATTQWAAATQGGASVKVVIMDGGSQDCQTGGSCSTCQSSFQTLLSNMAAVGVQDVLFTRYPDFTTSGLATLKACIDAVMPDMQTTCESSTSPRCHWVDLRPVWITVTDTSDGVHPTTTGAAHCGDLIWSEMVKNCVAQ